MKIQTWPLLIQIFKGENRILIIPVIDHIAGYSVDSEWYVRIEEMEDYLTIGRSIFSAVDVIKKSPCSTLTRKEREKVSALKKNSKYKSWISFWKNNLSASVEFFEDGHYRIYSLKKSKTKQGIYDECVKEIHLLEDAKEEEIGQAIIDVFEASEEYHQGRKMGTNIKSIDLLDNAKLTITPPKDTHFTDNDDSGAAEIYQCYSYSTSENAEPAGEFFLGIAPELDCDLKPENVRSSWEDYYGKADFFEMKEANYGIFKYRVEMRNKESHKISYILQQEEDLLLECGMEVHTPNRRKKTDEKLEAIFAEFTLSCKLC